MNRRAVAAIVRKDLMVVVRSKAVLLPLIIVPLLPPSNPQRPLPSSAVSCRILRGL